MTVYLAQHYAGGRILEDGFTTHTNANSLESEAGIDFKNMIREDSGNAWIQSLRAPAEMVDWIIVNPGNPNDLIARHIDVHSQAFLSQFTLTVREADGLSLYHHNGLAPLPTRPISLDLFAAHQLCPTSTPGSGSDSIALIWGGSMDKIYR